MLGVRRFIVPVVTAVEPQPGKVFESTQKPIWILLSVPGIALPLWQTSQTMPREFTWVLWAPMLAGGLPVPRIPVSPAPYLPTRPVGPPKVAVVGGLPWHVLHAPVGLNPSLWRWQVVQTAPLLWDVPVPSFLWYLVCVWQTSQMACVDVPSAKEFAPAFVKNFTVREMFTVGVTLVFV